MATVGECPVCKLEQPLEPGRRGRVAMHYVLADDGQTSVRCSGSWNSPSILEPIGEGRYVVDGALYLVTVNRGGLDFHVQCVRCEAKWSHPVSFERMRSIYVVIPAQPSAKTYVDRIEFCRDLMKRSAGHLCMPRGYTNVPTVILKRIDKHAPRSEQLEALAETIMELAADARRGDLA